MAQALWRREGGGGAIGGNGTPTTALKCSETMQPILRLHVDAQAGQAVEPAALVPLQMVAPQGCAVLVGDPQQLPATVISRAAQQAGLPLSLFQRLQQARPPGQLTSCQRLSGRTLRVAVCVR